MRKHLLRAAFLAVSLALHLFFVRLVDFSIDGSKTPLLYSWPDIISQDELFNTKKPFSLPQGVELLTEKLPRDVFVNSPIKTLNLQWPRRFQQGVSPHIQPLSGLNLAIKSDNSPFYFWDRLARLDTGPGEQVAYSAYVSSHGKVLFMYPEKLVVNSARDFTYQDYLRTSSFFLTDKFFWTKLEGVVK